LLALVVRLVKLRAGCLPAHLAGYQPAEAAEKLLLSDLRKPSGENEFLASSASLHHIAIEMTGTAY
jgi:hypothetical protein